jgi:NAD(P)-dependent dehydrogenase (short-subunit alcohol dehydrogenase family)
VTGGGQGIGLSIALGFAKASASHVILLGRTLATLLSGQAKILSLYPSCKVHLFVADVTESQAIFSTFTKIHEEIGPIDICVSNASYLAQLCPIATASIDDWFKGFEVMVKGAIIIAQEFLKHRSEKNSAFISITSSVVQMGHVPSFSAYASAKIGVAKAMEYLQSENPDMRVVSVYPGVIRSDMSLATEKAYGVEFDFDDCKLKHVLRVHVDADACCVDELPGHFCVWVTSPEADFLGGRYVWAAWDVDELIARKEDILKNDILRFGLIQ